MIQEYAREKLDAAGAFEATGGRHAAFYKDLSRALRAALRGPEQAAWVTRLGGGSGAGDIDNLRSTLRWSIDHDELDDVATIVWSMWLLAWVSGRLQECRSWAREAEGADGPLTPAGHARLLTVAGLFEMWSGEYPIASPALTQAVEIARGLDDADLLATALLGLSMVTAWAENVAAAKPLAEEANALFREQRDLWGQATSYSILTWFLVGEDDFESAATTFDEAMRVAKEHADELNRAQIETNVAEYLMHRGELEDASRLLEASLSRYRVLRALYPGAYALDAAARLISRTGSAATAAVLLGAADGLRTTLSVPVEGAHRARRQRLLAELQHELGTELFEQSLSEGRSVDLDKAANIALEAL